MTPKIFTNHWNLIGQVAAVVLAAIGGFWLPATEDLRETAFARFVLYLSVGLMLVPTWKYASKQHLGLWASLGVVFLIACLGAYFSYQHFLSRWTCGYAGKAVVIGSAQDLTKQGAKYFRDNPSATNSDAVMAHGGDLELIWSPAAMAQRRQMLSILYIVSGPLFAAAMIAVIQTVYCAQRKS